MKRRNGNADLAYLQAGVMGVPPACGGEWRK
jgi:hypothetical protein